MEGDLNNADDLKNEDELKNKDRLMTMPKKYGNFLHTTLKHIACLLGKLRVSSLTLQYK